MMGDKGLPRVQKIAGKMSTRWGTGTVVIPAPREVDEVMAAVPKGKVITINDIRSFMAKKHKADIGCPVTTGIFAWIAAHAAAEQQAGGKKRITPWWRTLKTGGELNDRYPGGIPLQRQLLEAEGHTITCKGKKYRLLDYEKCLFTP